MTAILIITLLSPLTAQSASFSFTRFRRRLQKTNIYSSASPKQIQDNHQKKVHSSIFPLLLSPILILQRNQPNQATKPKSAQYLFTFNFDYSKVPFAITTHLQYPTSEIFRLQHNSANTYKSTHPIPFTKHPAPI